MTYPTQPFPSLPRALAIQVPSAAQVAAVQKAAGRSVPTAVAKLVHAIQEYDDGDGAGAGGRHELAALELQSRDAPIICMRSERRLGHDGRRCPNPTPKPQRRLAHDVGSIRTVGNGFHNTGYFAAVDVTTGRVAWQHHFSDSCYSGSAVTAGNLVFVGRNSGELQAYSAKTGALLWHFQTGAGANNVATVFRHNGKEYLAFFAGGARSRDAARRQPLALRFRRNARAGVATRRGHGPTARG